jgi:hypothetical protein
MVLKWITLADRNILNAARLPLVKTREPTVAGTNSNPTSVADAVPSRA